MSVRDALRKLSRTFPAPPEIKEILEALDKEPDRSAAIIAASLIEGALERLIARYLVHSYPELLGQLFTNRGPVSDFHSKIVVATAFGVISRNMGEELHMVKAIRNAFAHSTSSVTFNTPEAANAINSISNILKAIRAVDETMEERFKTKVDNKAAFIMVVRILFVIIDNDHQQKGGASLTA